MIVTKTSNLRVWKRKKTLILYTFLEEARNIFLTLEKKIIFINFQFIHLQISTFNFKSF